MRRSEEEKEDGRLDDSAAAVSVTSVVSSVFQKSSSCGVSSPEYREDVCQGTFQTSKKDTWLVVVVVFSPFSLCPFLHCDSATAAAQE